jgi:hypothetical protein
LEFAELACNCGGDDWRQSHDQQQDADAIKEPAAMVLRPSVESLQAATHPVTILDALAIGPIQPDRCESRAAGGARVGGAL